MRPGRRFTTISALTMKSDRMGGADALFVDPIATVNFDYVYVK